MPDSNYFNQLLEGNKTFAKSFAAENPELLAELAKTQKPKVLWLGCSDSRIPETTICGHKPGDIFVHRNIANVVTDGDYSCSSVIAYSVGVVGVEHVIVCGHTKCGGANASMNDNDLGEVLNAWLKPVRDLRKSKWEELETLPEEERADKLAEWNVHASVDSVKRHPVVQQAIQERGLEVHGVIYDVPTAELKVVDCDH